MHFKAFESGTDILVEVWEETDGFDPTGAPIKVGRLVTTLTFGPPEPTFDDKGNELPVDRKALIRAELDALYPSGETAAPPAPVPVDL